MQKEYLEVPIMGSESQESSLAKEINKCTTAAQVMKVLKKHNRKIVKDETAEFQECYGKKAFSIWISKTERIYRPHRSKTMRYQRWKKIDATYSGIPTFFATPSYF